MSRVCQITGKHPMSGNNVSHAKNRTRRRFLPNLHTQRFWLENEKRFIKLKISHKGLRIIDKLGIDQVVKDLRERGEI
jgi:large subunit ribosomal protein L28